MDHRSIHISFVPGTATLPDHLDHLPSGPGVYQHRDSEGKVLYVGKAKNIRSRVRQYFQKSRKTDPRMDAMVGKSVEIEVIVTDSEVEALILESNLIKQLRPRYNVILKDDKSYPFIVITDEPFPRVFVTRQIRKDGSRYFGPYTDVKNVRAALKSVRDIFMIRSCNFFIDDEVIRKRKIRVCLDYHIKKCEGPCEGLVSLERYGAMIEQVAGLLEGRTGAMIAAMEQEMESLARDMKFEEAALVRDRIAGLRAYNEKQKVVSLDEEDRDVVGVSAEDDAACGVVFRIREGKMIGRQHYYMAGVEGVEEAEVMKTMLQQYYLSAEFVPPEILLPCHPRDEEAILTWLSDRRGGNVRLTMPGGDENESLVRLANQNAAFLLGELKLRKMERSGQVPHAVVSLQTDLRLASLPRRIECFDISNIQGRDAVASLVVFHDGKPRKSEYRKFRIGSVEGPDDFSSMREVIHRRYTRLVDEDGGLPDLVVVDGGKGQLSSAMSVLNELELGDLPVIGLAKRLEEIFVPGSREPVVLPKASASLRLLQRIRDEAHRFAVTYHRSVRTRRTLQSELDLIRGIGRKRAKELLEAFGSVQGVKFATEEQLAEIVGAKVAGNIRDHFETADPGGSSRDSVDPTGN